MLEFFLGLAQSSIEAQKNPEKTKLVRRARWLTYQPFAAMYCSGVKWFNRNFFVWIYLNQLFSFVGFWFGM
jgi:hypothetical protein